MADRPDIDQEAALWILRREEAGWSAADEAAPSAWLDRSLAHKASFWRLEQGWRDADRIAALGTRTPPERELPSRRPWLLPIAAVFVGLLGLAGVQLARTPGDQNVGLERFATPIGGHEVISLPDGSKVELNTASVLAAKLTSRTREVWLDRGEGYFDVAHNAARPFIVHAGSRTITVLGTKFAVRRDGRKVVVSVISGRVRVADADQPDRVPTAIITAGDIAVAQGKSTLLAATSEAQVKTALAWREGLLRFDHATLAEAVTEFNRYNDYQITLDDPKVRAISIGGTFKAANAPAFVRLLHDAYGLKVTSDADGAVISGG